MLKHIITIIVLSLLVIMAMPYMQNGLHWIMAGHDWVLDRLGSIFSGGYAGNLIRNLIALLAMPVVIACVPGLIYWLTKKRWFPYFMEVVWIIWLVQAAALVNQFNAMI